MRILTRGCTPWSEKGLDSVQTSWQYTFEEQSLQFYTERYRDRPWISSRSRFVVLTYARDQKLNLRFATPRSGDWRSLRFLLDLHDLIDGFCPREAKSLREEIYFGVKLDGSVLSCAELATSTDTLSLQTVTNSVAAELYRRYA